VTSLIDTLAASPGIFTGACVVFGLLFGSFLNVVIHRLPIMLDRQWREQCAELMAEASGAAATETSAPAAQADRFNLFVPASACPSCKTPIRAWQNVPVVSYLLLKGRCAACGTSISARYPLVEALTGIVSGLVAWKFGFSWAAAGALVFSWFLIALTFIDVDRQLLPDALTLPLIWLGLLFSLWHPEAGLAGFPVDLRSSLIGAVVGYLSLWAVYHLFRLATGKEGMGYGDFKLLAAIGAWLGLKMLLPTILVSALVGAVVGAVILVVKGRDKGTPIAFGPFLAAAGWIMLMCGPAIVDRYMGFFGPRS